MEWWVGNYWVVIGIIVLSYLIGLWWFRNRAINEVEPWRPLNYAILFIGGIGLLGLVIDSQRDIGLREVQIALPIYRSSLSFLKSDMRSWKQYFCETQFRKSDMSPPNFDDIVAEQKVLCEWFQRAVAKIDPLADVDAKKFSIEQVGELPASAFFLDVTRLVLESYRRFDRERQTLVAAEARSDTGEVKFFITVFAPMLLGLALGLSLAKAHYVP